MERKFKSFKSMSSAEKRKFVKGVQKLVKQAEDIGVRVSTEMDGEITIGTMLRKRKAGTGLTFMRKKDVWPGSHRLGRNPEW